MHHNTLAPLIPCTILLLAYICSYMLDYAEPELEVPMEQAQVEEFPNLELDQGKPQCIPPKSLSFIFETLFIIHYACALSL
jgi:hypothetical protein